MTEVELLVAPMATGWLTERVIPSPMSIYPEYAGRRSAWYRNMTAGVVRVTVEDGTQGLGFVGCGRARAVAVLLEDQVRDLVVGVDCFRTEYVSELLARATVMYGQGGLTGSLRSGIDIALWDIKGRLLGRPVHDLLGGRTQADLPVYATSFGAEALETIGFRELGLRDVKITPPCGPRDGEEGIRRNVEAVQRTRELLGPGGFISLDCYMGWDVPYTIGMVRRLDGYGLGWVEEPVLPDDIAGYAAIKEAVEVRVAGGEHVFTLEGLRRLIVDGGVDLVQADIYRAGGPTVLKKVAALARAYNRELICHGGGSPTYHFLITNGPDVTPRAEWLDIRQGSDAGWVLDEPLEVRDGRLTVGDEPGFGYELNQAAFAKGTAVSPIW